MQHFLLYSFYVPNGEDPVGLALGPHGVLYGATSLGGVTQYNTDAGVVFQLTPPATPGGAWTETVLYNFSGLYGDGGQPSAAPVVAANGSLYGTTPYGGNAGLGTVYELTPAAGGAWTERVLYSFTGQNGDAQHPYAGLVIGINGALYGTTPLGGASSNGAVFAVMPPSTPGGAWTESVIYSFTGQSGDGTNPYAGLVMDAKGALYGTTEYGGAAGLGTIYKLTPPSAPGSP